MKLSNRTEGNTDVKIYFMCTKEINNELHTSIRVCNCVNIHDANYLAQNSKFYHLSCYLIKVLPKFFADVRPWLLIRFLKAFLSRKNVYLSFLESFLLALFC